MFATNTPFVAGRNPAVALFNKQNGIYISVSNYLPEDMDKIDTDLYIAREVMFDFTNDTIEGDIIINKDGTTTDDFKVVDKSEVRPVIYETQLNSRAEYKITKRYPVIEQINILSRSLQLIAEKTGTALPELEELTDYIKLCLDTNKAQKEFYRGSPDVTYITEEEHTERESARFEGGLHEIIGPRVITGGSVFKTDIVKLG